MPTAVPGVFPRRSLYKRRDHRHTHTFTHAMFESSHKQRLELPLQDGASDSKKFFRLQSVTRTLRLTQFQGTQLKKKKQKLKSIIFELRRYFNCWNASAMRRKWRKNIAGRHPRGRGGLVAADQVPACWSLDVKLGLPWLYAKPLPYIHPNATCSGPSETWLLPKSYSAFRSTAISMDCNLQQ